MSEHRFPHRPARALRRGLYLDARTTAPGCAHERLVALARLPFRLALSCGAGAMRVTRVLGAAVRPAPTPITSAALRRCVAAVASLPLRSRRARVTAAALSCWTTHFPRTPPCPSNPRPVLSSARSRPCLSNLRLPLSCGSAPSGLPSSRASRARCSRSSAPAATSTPRMMVSC